MALMYGCKLCQYCNVPERSKLVSSGRVAAKLGVDPSTIWRWQQAGIITPEWVTPGGRARWNLDEVLTQLHRIKVVA